MQSNFMVLKDGEEVLVDDTEENRHKAKAKNLDVHESFTSPDGEETFVPQHLAKAALKKGYQFSDTYVPPPVRERHYGGVEAALMSGTESALLGMDDEIIGRGKQIFKGEDYQKARDLHRQEKKWAQEDSPEESTMGSIAGGVASAIALPGMGLAKGAGLGARALAAGAEGAVLGGAAGYGMSDSDKLSEQAKDTLSGAAMGGATGAGVTGAVGGLAAGMSKIPPIRKMQRSFYEKVGEIPEHISSKIMKEPDSVQRAYDSPGAGSIAQQVADTTNKLKKDLEGETEAAWAALIKEDEKGTKLPSGISLMRRGTPIYKENGLESNQGAQKIASKKLSDAMRDVREVTDFKSLKKAVQGIDRNLNYQDQSHNLANKVLVQFRTALDKELKNIDAYKTAMAPVAAKSKMIEELHQTYGLKRGSTTVNGNVEPLLYPSDRTISQTETAASQSLMNDSKGEISRKSMRNVVPELVGAIEDHGLHKFMEKDIGRGGRSAYAGGAIGLLGQAIGIPYWISGAVGAATGYARDKGGRRFAAEGLAKIGRSSLEAGSKVGGNVAGVLEKAFKKGGNAAVLVYHSVLMKNNPEYKRAFEETQNNSDEDNNGE